MIIKAARKVIKIGSSSGVTLPAKDLRYAGISPGDKVEVTIMSKKAPRGASNKSEDDEIIKAAKDVLQRYKQDFDNLAQR